MPLPLLTLLLALTLTPQSTALQLHLHLHLPTPLPANFFIHLNAIPHPLPLPPLPNGEYTLQPFSETQRFPKYRFAILPSYNTKGEGEGEEKEEKEGEEEEGGIYNLHEETPGIQYIATTPIKSEPVIIIKAYETGECYKETETSWSQMFINLLSNPMMLMLALGVLMMTAFPYLMKNMDPEALKEMQEQQAQMQNPMTSLQNADLAETMARMFGGKKSDGTQKTIGGAK